jgi:hypothetical protein
VNPMNERDCSSPDDPAPAQRERYDGDLACDGTCADAASGNTESNQGPARQVRIKPWRWQVR